MNNPIQCDECKSHNKFHAAWCSHFKNYKAIKEEMGFTLLTEEDMIWIDRNTKEDPKARP